MLSIRRGRTRVIALCLVGALGASISEATAGSLRDGWVHREIAETLDSPSASDESTRAGRRLSSDDGNPSATSAAAGSLLPSGPEGPGHGHFGDAGHSGHAHGAALTSSLHMVFIPAVMDAPAAAPLPREAWATKSVRRPPRA